MFSQFLQISKNTIRPTIRAIPQTIRRISATKSMEVVQEKNRVVQTLNFLSETPFEEWNDQQVLQLCTQDMPQLKKLLRSPQLYKNSNSLLKEFCWAVYSMSTNDDPHTQCCRDFAMCVLFMIDCSNRELALAHHESRQAENFYNHLENIRA